MPFHNYLKKITKYRDPFFVLGLLLIIVSTNVLGQDQNKIDSLTVLYQKSQKDSTRIDILVNLWRATIYNRPEEAKEYAHQIIQKSSEFNLDFGIATGHQRLAIYYDNKNINDSARLNYFKSIEIYQNIGDSRLEGSMLFNVGLSFQNESEYDSALYYIQMAKSLFEAGQFQKQIGAAYNGIAGIELEKGNYKLALENAQKAARIFEEINDEIHLADAQLKIGQAYSQTGSAQKAIDYFKKSLNTFRKNYDDEYSAQALHNIGQSFSALKKRDSSRYYLNEALILASKIESPDLLANINADLGLVYYENNELNLALAFFEKSLKISQGINYNILTAANQINIGNIYLDKKDLNKAKEVALKGLELAINTQVKENVFAAYQVLSSISKAQGNYKEALDYYILYKNTKDSVYNIQKSAQIAELQTLFETEKKDNEIRLQSAEIIGLKKQAEIDGLRKTLLGFGLLFIVVLAGLLYYATRQKMKRNKLEREKERLAFEQELTVKKKELTTHTLHLVQKNEILNEVKVKLEELKKNLGSDASGVNRLIQVIKNDRQSEKDWDNFKIYFEQVHKDFDNKLRENFNDLTNNELRLAALMKMNLSSKEIAGILNISPDSVNKARYRLRKKLSQESDQNLQNFLLAL